MLPAHLQHDFDQLDLEDLEAAEAVADHLADGSHYQRQVDAMRDMGMVAGAETLKKRLAGQGITVS